MQLLPNICTFCIIMICAMLHRVYFWFTLCRAGEKTDGWEKKHKSGHLIWHCVGEGRTGYAEILVNLLGLKKERQTFFGF